MLRPLSISMFSRWSTKHTLLGNSYWSFERRPEHHGIFLVWSLMETPIRKLRPQSLSRATNRRRFLVSLFHTRSMAVSRSAKGCCQSKAHGSIRSKRRPKIPDTPKASTGVNDWWLSSLNVCTKVRLCNKGRPSSLPRASTGLGALRRKSRLQCMLSCESAFLSERLGKPKRA